MKRLIVQNSKVIKEHRVKYLPHHYLPAIQVLLQFLEHTSKAVQCIYKYTLTCILIFFLFFLLIFNCTIIAVWFLPYINLKEPYILWKIYLSPMYTNCDPQKRNETSVPWMWLSVPSTRMP